MPWEVPNGDLNQDGVYPDIVINRNGKLVPMYRSDIWKDKIVCGDEGLAKFNLNAPEVDYDAIEKKLNDDHQDGSDNSLLGHIIRDWIWN